MVKMVNFMLCVFYCSTKKLKEKEELKQKDLVPGQPSIMTNTSIVPYVVNVD